MKLIKYFMAFMIFSYSISYALTPDDVRINANKYYSWLLSEISIAKDKSYSQYRRELALKNLSDALQDESSSGLLSIKDGFIELLIDDPAFFFYEITKASDAYKIWMEKLNFDWLYDGKSKYPEMKSLAIKSLEYDIEKTEMLLKVKRDTLKKIKSIKLDVLH